MSKIQFSPDQEKAITGRGQALLVSAAAGSGKTAVLVERVLRYLAEQGGDIRRLIIMTYTTAAADEMRMKIKRAVDEAVALQGGDHLLKQSTLIESARIGTIHSICLDLIVRHFEQLEMDPACRLVDEAADQKMVEEQLEALLEELYGSDDQEIQHFLSCFASGREDATLQELIISGMRHLEKQPLPQDTVRRALAPYKSEAENLFDRFTEDGLYQFLHLHTMELLEEYTDMKEGVKRDRALCLYPKLIDFLEEEYQKLCDIERILNHRNYQEFSDAMVAFAFGKLTFAKDCDPDAKERLQNRRKKIKENFADLKKAVEQTEQEELCRLAKQGSLLRIYFEICTRLNERLQKERRRLGLISYADMEQLAVKLLVEHYDSDTDLLTPSPLAKQLQEDYDEIIIDEFQDSNRAQDLIFRALSKEEKNLFMVGDIKQSIYRFRGAEPELFGQKRQKSVPFGEQMPNASAVLELKANYRSHPGVIRVVNGIFGSLMNLRLGGAVYDERERMRAERPYDHGEQSVAELHHLLPTIDEVTGKKINVTVQNARYVAAWIKDFIAEGRKIDLPGGGSRPAEYRDFAILLRTASGCAAVFERELSRLGIPVSNDKESTPFYELWEVQSILSYLMVLNNPFDDVAMVSLLYGDYFRFSVGELGAMRRKNTFLYDDLKEQSKTDTHAAAAYERICRYRKMSRSLYVYELLERIFAESGIMEFYSQMEQGAEKQANLEELLEEARLFERDGYKGLYAFIEYIRLNQSNVERGGVRLQAEQNCVQIMSIHRSKGLEFPVCILGDLQKKCNLQDKNGKILLHSRYGAAVEQIDPQVYGHCRSLGQQVLADQIVTDSISEEERVLYVALTRAQSRLMLVATVEQEQVEQWTFEGASLDGPLPDWMIRGKNASYARWIFTLLAASQEGAPLRQSLGLFEKEYPALGMTYHRGELPSLCQKKVKKQERAPFNLEEFRKRLDWSYPFEKSVRLPAKLSVSELKGIRQPDEEAENLLEERVRAVRPRFINPLGAAGNEVGNAIHQALQYSDFLLLKKDPEKELDRLVENRFILPRQRELIEIEKLRRFTESGSFKNLLTADYYSKEERFLFPLPAAALFGKEAEGEILIQGVLDCYSVCGEEAVILDYKTDRVDSEEELIRRYRVQMELYAEALRRIKGLTVVRCEIYSFSLGKTIIL